MCVYVFANLTFAAVVLARVRHIARLTATRVTAQRLVYTGTKLVVTVIKRADLTLR